MRSFLGVSNHGPFVGISVSRYSRRRRRSYSRHYARPTSSDYAAMARILNPGRTRAERAAQVELLAATDAAIAANNRYVRRVILEARLDAARFELKEAEKQLALTEERAKLIIRNRRRDVS